MSDVDTSDTDEELDSDDVIVIKAFATQNAKGKTSKSQAGTANQRSKHAAMPGARLRGSYRQGMLPN